MQVYVYKDPEHAAQAAAAVFVSTAIAKPDAVFGLATGSTPLPLYQALIRLNRAGLVDFSRVSTWNLDEYAGLAGDHVASYRRFMNENLFDHINIDKANTHVPSGTAPDLDAEAQSYDARIAAAGGIDVQLLGIGHNGHIGFNEPAPQFVFGTHVVALTQSTIDANARFFESADDVPREAISMGIGSIMLSERIVLIATGSGKADIIKRTLQGEVDPQVPSTILRCHRNVQVFLDEAAAARL